MINCKYFCDSLAEFGVDFFVGVPDSTLKDFCNYISRDSFPYKHIIAANEGGAVALACGHYLATRHIGLVYMQNSGQGNVMNPLVSLADKSVYSIPVLLLIGWRGEPGKKDEPQHIKQGNITLSFLDMLDIPYRFLPNTNGFLKECLEEVFSLLWNRSTPVALVVRKGTFEPYEMREEKDLFKLKREDAIKIIVEKLEERDVIVSTTGKTSRELYECRERLGQGHNNDFLTIGSMGHASQIAMGIAISEPSRRIFCLDGDGAVIMHMGALAIIGAHKVRNFHHIIINNSSHDSVGGQPTVGFSISFPDIAKACGYSLCLRASTVNEISEKLDILKVTPGPTLLEIKTRKGSRPNLGRPKISPQENKEEFMKFLR